MASLNNNTTSTVGSNTDAVLVPGNGTAPQPVDHSNHPSLKPQAMDVLADIIAKHGGSWSRTEIVAADGSVTHRYTIESAIGDRIAGNGATALDAALDLQRRLEFING